VPDKKNYDLSLNEVIPRLESELADMRAAEDREELVGIAPDTAFELGYETCLHDLRRLTGPDPVEVGLITYYKEPEDDQQ
jgi:hypothetical protein